MRMAAYVALGQLMFFVGEFSFAAELCDRGLSLPGEIPAAPLSDIGDPRTMNLALSASALSVLGYPARALARSREAMAEGRRAGPHSFALALSYAGETRMRLGDAAGAIELSQAMAEIAAEHGFSMWLAQADDLRGEALVKLGQYEEALAALKQGAKAYETTGAVAGLWRLAAAEAHRKLGNYDEAFELVSKTREFVEKAGLRVAEAETYRVLGELLIERDGNEAEGEKWLRKAMESARHQHAKLYELRATMALARLLENSGRRGEARAILTVIYHWFTEGLDIPDLNAAREFLNHLSSTDPDDVD